MNQPTPPAHARAGLAGFAGLALSVEGVDLRFGGIHALRAVSFAAAPSQISAVIGPNGAGKTSVFNTISGFYRPAAGRIRLGDEDITDVPVHARAARGLARTFQNIALFHGLSVLENIKLGGHHTMKAGVFSAPAYGRAVREEETALRAEVERKVIEFLEIDNIRHLSVDVLPYGLQSASSWPARCQAEVDATNGKMPQVQQVRKFHLLTKELDHDDDEVTATMKVRRKSIAEKYATVIEDIYA